LHFRQTVSICPLSTPLALNNNVWSLLQRISTEFPLFFNNPIESTFAVAMLYLEPPNYIVENLRSINLTVKKKRNTQGKNYSLMAAETQLLTIE
jgi:hypothetical protein